MMINQVERKSTKGGKPLRFTRITVNPRQMGGVPCIRGLRIPAATVVWQVITRSPEKTEEFVRFTAEAFFKSYA
jgi:uncharacterized protein (DUF433 family)